MSESEYLKEKISQKFMLLLKSGDLHQRRGEMRKLLDSLHFVDSFVSELKKDSNIHLPSEPESFKHVNLAQRVLEQTVANAFYDDDLESQQSTDDAESGEESYCSADTLKSRNIDSALDAPVAHTDIAFHHEGTEDCMCQYASKLVEQMRIGKSSFCLSVISDFFINTTYDKEKLKVWGGLIDDAIWDSDNYEQFLIVVKQFNEYAKSGVMRHKIIFEYNSLAVKNDHPALFVMDKIVRCLSKDHMQYWQQNVISDDWFNKDFKDFEKEQENVFSKANIFFHQHFEGNDIDTNCFNILGVVPVGSFILFLRVTPLQAFLIFAKIRSSKKIVETLLCDGFRSIFSAFECFSFCPKKENTRPLARIRAHFDIISCIPTLYFANEVLPWQHQEALSIKISDARLILDHKSIEERNISDACSVARMTSIVLPKFQNICSKAGIYHNATLSEFIDNLILKRELKDKDAKCLLQLAAAKGDTEAVKRLKNIEGVDLVATDGGILAYLLEHIEAQHVTVHEEAYRTSNEMVARFSGRDSESSPMFCNFFSPGGCGDKILSFLSPVSMCKLETVSTKYLVYMKGFQRQDGTKWMDHCNNLTEEVLLPFRILEGFFGVHRINWKLVYRDLFLLMYPKVNVRMPKFAQSNLRVHFRDRNGLCPLHWACLRGHPKTVEAFVDLNIDFTSLGERDGQTDQSAGQQRQQDQVKMLDLHISRMEAVLNAKDVKGRTPLYLAASCGHKEVVMTLLDHGVDITSLRSGKEVMDSFVTKSKSCLYIATKRGHLEVAMLILSKGADINTGVIQTDIWKSEVFKTEPLFHAAKNGDLLMLRFLLSKGAKVNASKTRRSFNDKGDNTRSTPALFAAVENGHFDVVKTLLENNADSNESEWHDIQGTEWGNKLRMPTLYRAVQKRNLEIVKLLLEHRADPNSKYKDFSIQTRSTPALYHAAGFGQLEIVQLLLKNRAYANTAQSFGDELMPSLYFAAKNGHSLVVKVLLENGANVDSLYWSNSPVSISPCLFKAAMKGHLEVVRILLQNRADVHLPYYAFSEKVDFRVRKAAFSTTAVEAATDKGFSEIVKLLLTEAD